MDSKTNNWFQGLLVLIITGATVYMAVRNNSTDVIFSLATACFGYYFGSKVGSTNTKI